MHTPTWGKHARSPHPENSMVVSPQRAMSSFFLFPPKLELFPHWMTLPSCHHGRMLCFCLRRNLLPWSLITPAELYPCHETFMDDRKVMSLV